MSWRFRGVVSYVVLALVLLCPGSLAFAAEKPIEVLILHSGESNLPAHQIIDQSIRSILRSSRNMRVECYSEYLDLWRFPNHPNQQQFAELLNQKYRDLHLDLIIPVGAPAFYFLKQWEDEVFRNIPYVYCGLEKHFMKEGKLPEGVPGVPLQIDVSGTIELMLKIHPQMRQVFVITGASELDRALERAAREQLDAYQNRIEINYLNGLSIDDLLDRLGGLPEDAAVLLVSLYRDAKGELHSGPQAAYLLYRASSAPLYGISSTYMGQGILGGSIIDFEALGNRAGEMAVRVLNGESPKDIAATDEGTVINVVDRRELKRWEISESSLPEGVGVWYREETVWDKYRWQMVGIAVFILLQSMVTFILIANRIKRRRVELLLHQKEEGLAEAQRIARLGSWRWNVGTNELTGSDEAYRILGVTPENFRATMEAFLELVHPEDRELVSKEVEFCLSHPNEQREIVHRILWSDGTIRIVHERGVAIPGKLGEPLCIIGTIQDVTELKTAEEALRENEARLRLMADSLPVLISYVDKDEHYRFNNHAYEKWFGLTREGLYGKRVREVVGEEVYTQAEPYIKKVLGGEAVRFEISTPSSDGRLARHHKAIFMPHHDRNGCVSGFYTLVEDVTEARLVEMEIRKQRSELAYVSRINLMGELTASLAHELNQPLAAILSNAQAARRIISREDPDIAEITEILEDIIADDRRAGEVIRRLRSLLKRGKLEISDVNLNDLVKEVIRLVKPEVTLKEVSIELMLDENLPPVRADNIQLQQVIINFIINTCTAMKETKTGLRKVIIKTGRHESDSVMVSVKDNGKGLDAGAAGMLFEPFFTTNADGMGMGLAVCRHIIEKHGGSIWAANGLDQGAAFSFSLPFTNSGEAPN